MSNLTRVIGVLSIRNDRETRRSERRRRRRLIADLCDLASALREEASEELSRLGGARWTPK